MNTDGRNCDGMELMLAYIYQSVNFILAIDIDECALGTDQCTQNCHNNVGSYTCSCNAGYTLNSDGRRCDGRNNWLTTLAMYV